MALENYNNNDQQLDRHDFGWKFLSWTTGLDRLTINMVVKLLVTVMVFKGYPGTYYLWQGRVIFLFFLGEVGANIYLKIIITVFNALLQYIFI